VGVAVFLVAGAHANDSWDDSRELKYKEFDLELVATRTPETATNTGTNFGDLLTFR
jgi:hypothetical protein